MKYPRTLRAVRYGAPTIYGDSLIYVRPSGRYVIGERLNTEFIDEDGSGVRWLVECVGTISRRDGYTEYVFERVPEQDNGPRIVCPLSGAKRTRDLCAHCVEYVGNDSLHCVGGCSLSASRSEAFIATHAVSDTEAHCLCDHTPSPQETLDLELIRNRVLEVLNDTLGPREAHVLEMRFGLTGTGFKSLAEVAEDMRLTKERVRQIEAKAMRKLRHPTRIKKLLGLLEAYGYRREEP